MPYSAGFRASMVQRLADPQGPSAAELAREVGVSQSTLSRWLRQAGTLGDSEPVIPFPQARRAMSAKRPQDWSAEEKLQVVIEASSLSEEELGAFLRGKGLHEAQLQDWRRTVLSGLEQGSQRSRQAATREARRIRELQRELARKDRALAETAALLALKKKAQAIWGDEDDATDSRSGNGSCG